MKPTIFLSLSLFSFAALSSTPGVPIPDGIPTYQQFEKRVRPYPYLAPPERAQQILSGSSQLRSCLTKQQVSALLGPPDFSQLSYGPKGPGEKWLGSHWMYYLAKRSRSTNLNDPNMEIFFDTSDRAQWVVPTHIEGANELGGPKQQCTQPGAPADAAKRRG
jgi:hypothetical protein